MKSTDLSVFEKASIYYKANSDCKKNLFKDINGTELKEGTKKVISPFVLNEINLLIARRDIIICKRICRIRITSNNGHKHYAYKSLPNALACIDNNIGEIKNSIELLKKNYCDEIGTLTKQSSGLKGRGARPLAQKYYNIIASKRELYKKELTIYYERIVELINERIRLSQLIISKINVIKAWRISRIRYYYSSSFALSESLPMFVFKESDIFFGSGEYSYDAIPKKWLTDSEKQRDQLAKDFAEDLNDSSAEQ